VRRGRESSPRGNSRSESELRGARSSLELGSPAWGGGPAASPRARKSSPRGAPPPYASSSSSSSPYGWDNSQSHGSQAALRARQRTGSPQRAPSPRHNDSDAYGSQAAMRARRRGGSGGTPQRASSPRAAAAGTPYQGMTAGGGTQPQSGAHLQSTFVFG
jgi:hypothetical protein